MRKSDRDTALRAAQYCRRALHQRRRHHRNRCRILSAAALARVWDKRLAHELELEKLRRDLREIDTAPQPHRSTRKRKPLTPPKPPESKAEKEKRLEAEMEELRRKLDEI